MKVIFYKFGENFLKIFRGKNFLWHLLAIVLTYVAVISSFDWAYFSAFNGTPIQLFLFSAAVLGGLLPIILPIVLYAIGKFKKRAVLLGAAFAAAQAGILGWLVSSFYKIFTGRIQPPLFTPHPIDISRDFQFGVMRHGIFWGWPSSHTTIAFSIAVTLMILFPKNRTVRIMALATALFIGIGVSMSIHWFSDFLAGVIIGSVIGVVVGEAFFARIGKS